MEFIVELENNNNSKLQTVIIKHAGEILKCNCSVYNKVKFQDVGSLFNNINGFIKSLDSDKQTKLWKTYNAVFRAISETSDRVRLHEFVKTQLNEIYDIVEFNALKSWTLVKGKVKIPVELKNNYDIEVLTDRTRDRTYLRKEYGDLVILVIMLKMALPIFAAYLQAVKSDVASFHKDHFTFSLLKNTDLVKTDAFERFIKHMEASLEGEKNSKAAIAGGLGSSELADWFISRTVVRKLTIAEETVGNNIVANVYHGLTNSLESMNKTFGGMIKDKEVFGNQNSDDNTSVAENYKIKETISTGDLVAFLVYCEDPFEVAYKVDPSLDENKLRACLHLAETKQHLSVNRHTEVLTQWAISRAITPRSTMCLTKPVLFKMIPTAKALLWHWGLYELALLMLVEPVSQASSIATSSTTRLSKKYVDMFVELYPFYQAKNSKAEQRDREVNVAIKAINELSNYINAYDWRFYTLPEIASEMRYNNTTDVHVVTADIKTQQAELLLKVQELKRSSV